MFRASELKVWLAPSKGARRSAAARLSAMSDPNPSAPALLLLEGRITDGETVHVDAGEGGLVIQGTPVAAAA